MMKSRVLVFMLAFSICVPALALERERVVGWVGAMVGCATCKRQGEPTPAPKPIDGTKCENCDGTGVLPGDGTIKPSCPVCGGDGRVGAVAKPVAKIAKSVLKAVPLPAAGSCANGQCATQSPAVVDKASSCSGGKCNTRTRKWSLFRR